MPIFLLATRRLAGQTRKMVNLHRLGWNRRMTIIGVTEGGYPGVKLTHPYIRRMIPADGLSRRSAAILGGDRV